MQGNSHIWGAYPGTVHFDDQKYLSCIKYGLIVYLYGYRCKVYSSLNETKKHEISFQQFKNLSCGEILCL